MHGNNSVICHFCLKSQSGKNSDVIVFFLISCVQQRRIALVCFYSLYQEKYKLVRGKVLEVDRIRLAVIVFTLGAEK